MTGAAPRACPSRRLAPPVGRAPASAETVPVRPHARSALLLLARARGPRPVLCQTVPMSPHARSVLLLLALAAAPAFADEPAPADGWLCVPPAARAWSRCHKGSALSEESLAACRQREASAPRRPARFRVDAGAWVEFSASRRRCVRVPVGATFRVTVEDTASWKDAVPATCASRVLDVVEPNFYGAVTSRCATRDTSGDERLGAADAGTAR